MELARPIITTLRIHCFVAADLQILLQERKLFGVVTKVPYRQALRTQVVPDAEVPLALLQDVLDRLFSQAFLGD